MENREVARVLRETAQLLEIDGAIIGRYKLLEQIGEPVLAREARHRALDLCQNPAERSLLERKLRG